MMASHRAQAQFERARWRAIVLFPVWTVQLLLTGSMMVFFAWRMNDTLKHYAERDKEKKALSIELAWEITNIVLSFVAAICTLIEAIKYMVQALTPWTMFFTHIIKLICASAICILDAVVYARRKEYQSLIGLGLDVGLLVTGIALAIYSAATYRRLSQFDDYVRPVNVKGYGFNNDNNRDFSSSSRLSVRNSIDKRPSMGIRRLSVDSANSQPVRLQIIQRPTGHYSHKRDTQFDEYRARRNSLNNTRPGLERESSIEYRLYSLTGASSSPSPLVATGMGQTRPPRLSINRAISYTSNHLLVAVPEEDPDASEAGFQQSDDKTSLLRGNSRRISDKSTMQPVQDVDITEPKWRRE